MTKSQLRIRSTGEETYASRAARRYRPSPLSASIPLGTPKVREAEALTDGEDTGKRGTKLRRNTMGNAANGSR